MKQSGNGYKLSKFVQKIFADFIGDAGAFYGSTSSLFSAHQILRISPPGTGSIVVVVRAEEKLTPDLIPEGEK